MNDLLFTVIAGAATFAFLAGVVSGTWPLLLMGLAVAGLILWLSGRLRP